MDIRHLGNGVIYIENLIDSIPESFKTNLDEVSASIAPQAYSTVGEKTVNGGGYEMSSEEKNRSPERFTNLSNNISFAKELSDLAYLGLIEYLKVFPIAIECITARCGGHLIKYTEGQEMGPHSDCALPYRSGTLEPLSLSPLGNTLTSAIFLNDEYTGGNVLFRIWGIMVKPKAGSMLIYPSSFIGCHEVATVESGVRWVFLERFYQGGPGNLDIRYKWIEKLKSDIGLTNSEQKQVLVGPVKL